MHTPICPCSNCCGASGSSLVASVLLSRPSLVLIAVGGIALYAAAGPVALFAAPVLAVGVIVRLAVTANRRMHVQRPAVPARTQHVLTGRVLPALPATPTRQEIEMGKKLTHVINAADNEPSAMGGPRGVYGKADLKARLKAAEEAGVPVSVRKVGRAERKAK